MTNPQAFDRIEQCRGAKVEQLFWIPISHETLAFKDFFEELHAFESAFKSLFPDIDLEYPEDAFQELLDQHKCGFLAEVSIPTCYNFEFEGDRPVTYSRGSSSRIEYIYAETTEELIGKIEIVSQMLFDKWVSEAKSKQ